MECPYRPSASAQGGTPRPDAATWPAAGATSCLEDSQGGGGGKRRRGRGAKKKKTGLAAGKQKRLDRWFRQYFEAGSRHPQAYAGTGPVLREEPPKERKDKEAWLAAQTTHQIHRPARKRFPRRPFVVHSLDEMWQLDLSDMQWYKRENGGYAWILFAIDVFSRYVWTRPLKRKTGENTAAGLADIFREVADDPQRRHTLPRVVYVDRGSEFYNKNVKDLLASTPIPVALRSSHDETKAAVVERVQRTIKARLWKYLYQNGTSKWVDALPAIVDSYNHAYHTTLRRTPASITRDDEEAVWKTVHGARDAALQDEPRFALEVGDVVRISRQAKLFRKGYLPQWTEEWFRVRARDRGPPPYYRLEDLEGEDVEGPFYEPELQKVTPEEQKTATFRVEKVLKRRTRDGQREALVQYLGWPEKFNEWLPESQVQSLS